MTIILANLSDGISIADATKVLSDFRTDWSNEYNSVAITPLVIDEATKLAETHALRAYDAVQLAALLELDQQLKKHGIPSLTLICADIESNDAASAEGITVEDPNAHP